MLLKHVSVPSAFLVYPANVEWVARYLRIDEYDVPCLRRVFSYRRSEFYVVCFILRCIRILKFVHKGDVESGRNIKLFFDTLIMFNPNVDRCSDIW